MAQIDEVGRLIEAKTGYPGRGGNYRCPAHDDKSPSLSVTNGDGKVIMHCHAGCSVNDILAAIGLTFKDLFDQPADRGHDKPKILASYDYVDASGSLLFKVHRFTPKDFRQQAADGTWKLNGVRRVPYRLPQLVDAVKAGERIYVTEGEKDADAIVRAGGIATCNPEGAGKWRPEYDEHFRGADQIVIVADRDIPGYRHARQVAQHLRAVCDDVQIVEAIAGKDTADHLAAGHTIDDLGLLTDPMLTMLCEDSEPEPSLAAVPTADLFRRYTTAELIDTVGGFSWDVTGLLTSGTYGQIAGELKTLKTYISQFVQIGLASGTTILGRFPVPEARPVISYVGEGGKDPWTRRAMRVAEAMGVNLRDIPLFPSFDIAPISSQVFTESLARDLVEIRPGLFWMDPYYAYHGVKTSPANLHEEGSLLTGISTRCVDNGCSFMATNHMNQTGSGMNLKRITMAGSGEWVDTWILLAHREIPDVENGIFKLTMQIGSRQWGGTTWDLDLDIGRFDQDRGVHDGQITWDLRRASTTPNGSVGSSDDKDAKTRQTILEVINDKPGITKTDVYDLVRGARDRFHKAFSELADDGLIGHNQAGKTVDDSSRARVRWHTIPRTDQTVSPQDNDNEDF